MAKVKMIKKIFLAYEKVRKSGKTNMFDINAVITLCDIYISEEDCKDIMKNYTKYSKKFL